MILSENRLPVDDSHDISCLYFLILKKGTILNCRLLHIIGGALWVKALLQIKKVIKLDEIFYKDQGHFKCTKLHLFLQFRVNCPHSLSGQVKFRSKQSYQSEF